MWFSQRLDFPALLPSDWPLVSALNSSVLEKWFCESQIIDYGYQCGKQNKIKKAINITQLKEGRKSSLHFQKQIWYKVGNCHILCLMKSINPFKCVYPKDNRIPAWKTLGEAAMGRSSGVWRNSEALKWSLLNTNCVQVYVRGTFALLVGHAHSWKLGAGSSWPRQGVQARLNLIAGDQRGFMTHTGENRRNPKKTRLRFEPIYGMPWGGDPGDDPVSLLHCIGEGRG